MSESAKAWEAFRLAMPGKFTRMTKLCARCGQRVRLYEERDEQGRLLRSGLRCDRCRRDY